MASKYSFLKKCLRPLARIALLALVACSTGQCRRDGSAVMDQKTPVAKPSGYEPPAGQTVLVARPDGSKQCGMAPGVGLDKMAEDLAGITVLSSEKANDGMMRIQACGTDTGMHNVYKISQTDQAKAEAKGFKVFKR